MPVEVVGLTGVVSVAAAQSHSCAMLTNGGLQCWGAGFRGQLGRGNTNSSATAGPVRTIATARQIDAKGSNSCALIDTGVIYCWGDNASGQLAIGPPPELFDVPFAVMGLTP